MSRPADVIDDQTPWDGDRIDVPARIGWLLRVSRLGAGTSLTAMADSLTLRGRPATVTALSTLERTGVRDGAAIDAYERALGLPPGQLRAPVDLMCRAFLYAPADRWPEVGSQAGEPPGLDVVDAAWAAVQDRGADGGQWLWWARVLHDAGGAPVPTVVVRPLVERLLGEMLRAVGPAFVTRYEALAQLRGSPYDDLVEDAARALVDQEGAGPMLTEALGAVAERPTERLLAWCAGLLEHPSDWVVAAACHALQTMRAVGGIEEWRWDLVVSPLVAGHAATEHAARGRLYTQLFHVLPVLQRRAILALVERPLWPVEAPVSWENAVGSRHRALCERLGGDLGEAGALGDQPLLARLIFESCYDGRSTRVRTSAWLLMASPVVDDLQLELLRLAEHPPDEVTGRGALRALRHLQVPRGEEHVRDFFERTQSWTDPTALAVAGNAALMLPDPLARLAEGPAHPERLVEVLGMAADPVLRDVAEHHSLPSGTREMARWWLRTGARVTV